MENTVDTKVNQLQAKLERHITEYSYSQVSKLHQMENHLSDQLNTIRKDHFHADKRFRQLVDGIREVVFATGQQVDKLTDHFTAHNTYLEKVVDYFHVSKENHRNIAQYYKQMIGPLDKLEADMNYVVRTLKDHYLSLNQKIRLRVGILHLRVLPLLSRLLLLHKMLSLYICWRSCKLTPKTSVQDLKPSMMGWCLV